MTSFGVNDTTYEDGAVRVAPAESAGHLAKLLEEARAAGWPALVIGPPPVGDRSQNDRTAQLDDALAQVCADANVGYLGVLEHLLGSPIWIRQVAEGDGAHPASAGYEELAELVWPGRHGWITSGRPRVM